MPGTERRFSRRTRTGMSLLELVVATMIAVVAMVIFSRMAAAIASQRSINRENAIAADATRDLLETMRNEDFGLLFARYNGDPSDDPIATGPAPGPSFDVPGLRAITGDPDGQVGEILFPSIDLSAPGAGVPSLELREDLVDDVLGTPRDLNGDSIVDALDHTDDYYILPLTIQLRWEGRFGEREFVTTTMLCDLTP